MLHYHFSQIGTFHTNHNEDAFLSQPIGTHRQLMAVMDGCSMGTDSHFAATLVSRLLRKIAKAFYYQSFHTKQELPLASLLKQVLQQLFEQLKNSQNHLALERNELLTTLILSIVDEQYQKAMCLTIGDGLISYNGELIEYDQDNKPDYIGYHLATSFEDWYAAQTQQLSLTKVQDLSLVTDGIFTFQKFNAQSYPTIHPKQIIPFLLTDQAGKNLPNMLTKKVRHIEKEWGLKPTDDLTIVRVILP